MTTPRWAAARRREPGAAEGSRCGAARGPLAAVTAAAGPYRLSATREAAPSGSAGPAEA